MLMLGKVEEANIHITKPVNKSKQAYISVFESVLNLSKGRSWCKNKN